MKQKFIFIGKHLINPISWKNGTVFFVRVLPHILVKIYIFLPLMVLLIFYMLSQVYLLLEKIPFIGKAFKKISSHIWNKKVESAVNKIINKMEGSRRTSTQRMYLIYLANKNLKAKKARTLITILGMSVGIAIIVFLLSLGYGIERLVISQVATLDELKIVDVVAGTNSSINLNAAASRKFSAIKNVEEVVPIVSTVGRISLNKASTDVLVYAAPSQYFKIQNIIPEKGELYDSKKVAFSMSQEVAGASTALIHATYGKEVSGKTIEFNIEPQNPAPARLDCKVDTKVEGTVGRIEGGFEGKEMWGSDYYPFEDEGRQGFDLHTESALGVWVKGRMPLSFLGGDNVLRPILDDSGRQEWEDVCIEKKYITNEKESLINNNSSSGQVLGISTSGQDLVDSTTSSPEVLSSSTDSADLVPVDNSASDAAFLSFDNIVASSAAQNNTTTLLTFKGPLVKKAVVSKGLLEVLNLEESKAIGTKIEVSFIITKNVLPDVTGRAYTEKVNYEIIGILPDNTSPYFYIPFEDILKIGSVNYSQLKIRVNSENNVAGVRKNIEALGYRTSTTLDTVQQIESLFGNLRLLLGLLGLVALGVASLGMFNTLTVSLLERTREIGGMKTMGMVSDEIEDLLLSEALIMGLTGGIGGLILGDLLGKVLSLIVSLIALSHGQGYLNLTYIPFFLVAFIMTSSFIVGMFTGIIPAMRARKISALNALRYE